MDSFSIQHKNTNKIYTHYYSFADMSDFKDKDNYPRIEEMDSRAMAKKVFVENADQYNYYIRKGYDNKLYNPLSQINSKKDLSKLLSNDQLRFTLVTKKAFELFIGYLQTKDMKLFYQTEREI